jgi:hypothetical protein
MFRKGKKNFAAIAQLVLVEIENSVAASIFTIDCG